VSTSRTSPWRTRADQAAAQQAAALLALKAARTAVNTTEEAFQDADEAQQIVQAVAETIQEEAHDRIAGVVTRCLAAVFEEPYEFKIQFERIRGRTEARLQFVRDGMAINPIDSSGGGVVDVAAFALRVSCLMLARPAVRRVIILDEPFRFVSADRRGLVRAMLEGLSADLKIQMIIVTHMPEIQCGTIIDLGD